MDLLLLIFKSSDSIILLFFRMTTLELDNNFFFINKANSLTVKLSLKFGPKFHDPTKFFPFFEKSF